MSLSNISKFINTYSGRDKVIRTLGYCTMCASDLVSSKSAAIKLEIISSNLSTCRTILRLFDDIPMFSYTLSYKLGNKDTDKVVRVVEVLTNVADQLYYPLEHIAWAADNKLVNARSSFWWYASTLCWAVSLYLSLLRSLRCITLLQMQKSHLTRVEYDVRAAMEKVKYQQRYEILTALRCAADFINAVHWLPDGLFWSGKLKVWQVGALGTFSSIIGLYQSLRSFNGTS